MLINCLAQCGKRERSQEKGDRAERKNDRVESAIVMLGTRVFELNPPLK